MAQSSGQRSINGGSFQSRLPKWRVLVVEDTPELLTVLSELLRANNFEFVGESSAERAFRRLAVEIPDIIVCDVILPGKNGYEFLAEVRANPDWAHIPFVFISALSAKEEVRHGKLAGCDDYLVKPFDPEDLLAIIRGKLYQARQREKQLRTQLEGFRRRILHTLSHEFRTPLVSINTGAELLLEQDNVLSNEQSKKIVESIQRGGYRLERLINDFMLLQQIDLGQANSSYERFHRVQPFLYLVQSTIDGFLENMPEGLESRELEIVLEQEEAEWAKVDVYDVHVSHVISQLVSNAIKFGGADNPVELSLAVVGDEVEFKVRDHGPGLDSKDIQIACEPFMQIGRDFKEQQGAGLGLTIAVYFSEINGGTLSFAAPLEGSGLVAKLRFKAVS